MKTIIESITNNWKKSDIEDLRYQIDHEINMKDFPYIRKTTRNYKNNLLSNKFLRALNNVSGCDNNFKVAAVYDMMGYIEAQYDINAGNESAMDQGAYNMIEMMSDPDQNQNDFYAFIHTPSRGGNPSWSGLFWQYAEIAKLFLDPDFELI